MNELRREQMCDKTELLLFDIREELRGIKSWLEQIVYKENVHKNNELSQTLTIQDIPVSTVNNVSGVVIMDKINAVSSKEIKQADEIVKQVKQEVKPATSKRNPVKKRKTAKKAVKKSA